MKKLLSLVLALVMVFSVALVASAEEDIIKITWAQGTGDVAPKDNAMVLEKLNEMLRERIGVEVDIQYFTNDEILNSIQSGEVYDIYFTCSWYNNTNQAISQNLFLGLTQDEIAEKAPGLYNAMSKDVWDLAESADGKIYAIPNKKDYAAENFITYPADIAAELGFEIPDKIDAWDDMTDFLVAWKETLPEGEYPVLIGGNPAGLESSFDFIDRVAMIGCVYGTTKVVTVFEDPEVMERYRTMAKWYEMGLENPDVAQLTETAIDTSKQRINFVQAWDGYDYSPSSGYNVAMTRYFGPNLSVDGVQGSMNAFSITLADQPEKLEAALKLFEIIHTDKEVVDTLRYGVEGYHWNYVTAEQNPDCAGGVIQTEVGRTNYSCWGFSQPAYFFTSILVSEEQVAGTAKAPVMNQYELYYDAVATSANVSAMGAFKFNSEKWTAALAEMTAIKDEYYKNFCSGTISIDDCYDEFIEKMNAAGLQEMIEDAQEQLDAYLAAN